MNKWFKLYAGVVVVACYFLTLYTFTAAYFDNMSTLVTINNSGEANIEILVLGTSLLIILTWVIQLLTSKEDTQ